MKHIFIRYLKEQTPGHMRIVIGILILSTILLTACRKTNIKTDSNPANPDSVIVVKEDSPLVKTSTIYNYDATGTVVTDSSASEWIYDNQRRISSQTFSGTGLLDTFRYTYLNDRYTVSSNAYINGSLVMKSDAIYYQHLTGRNDSVVSVSTGYGAQAGSNSNGSTYFYYNQNNLDSLENTYTITNGIANLTSSVARYYTGSNLDSAVGRDGQGKLSYINYYSGGNETEGLYFNNGVQAGVINFTYSDIPSGALFFMYGTTKLQSGYTSITIPATSTFTETDAYQLDSLNRVSTILRDRHGISPNQKEVLTYY